MYVKYVDKLLITIISILFSSQLFSQDSQTRLANEYYLQGDQDKALEIFEKQASDVKEIPHIHSNYIALLLVKEEYAKAEKYLKKVNKLFPNNITYQSDLLYLYHQIPDDGEKEKLLNALENAYGNNQFQLNQLAQALVSHQMNEEALDLLVTARKVSGNPRAYALELAAIYRTLNQKESMVEEYLSYGLVSNRNTSYVKNLFQMLLTEEDDFDMLNKMLIQRVQKNPDELSYLELLIWINLQQNDFYGAFVQSKALDRRMDKPGDETMKVAQIAANNESWEDAVEFYNYVINTYPKSYHLVRARQKMLGAKESLLLSQVPIDKIALAQLAIEYQRLYDEVGPGPNTYEALKQKAILHAFYLNENEKAIAILQDLISSIAVPDKLRDESKLLLGDIYLIIDEPWEASLLYGQVQQSNKYDQLGYDARLRNARLYYFTGDFALANSYLKILKRATTKKISNNAIDLGLLINNNTILDTTDYAMKAFSKIELLTYQNKDDSAMLALQGFITTYPNHSLTDEVYWLLATTSYKNANYQTAIGYLDQIIENYGQDILGDDAAYNKAKWTEQHIGDTELAQQLYRDFITQYPGSLFASEARKRFRYLRGDIIN